MFKKIFPYIVLVAVALGFLLPVAQPTVMTAVTLPDPLVLLVQSAFVFAVGWAFTQIGGTLPWFDKLFGQYANAIAFALSGGVLAAAQTALDLIPPLWETPANIFLAFIVAVLTALQVFTLLGKAKVPTFSE